MNTRYLDDLGEGQTCNTNVLTLNEAEIDDVGTTQTADVRKSTWGATVLRHRGCWRPDVGNDLPPRYSKICVHSSTT